MQVHFQLATLKKGNRSITDYFQLLKNLSDTLAVVGRPLNDFKSVYFLLARLGYEYDPFVIFVITRIDSLSFDEIYGHLLTHELRIEKHFPYADRSVIVFSQSFFSFRGQSE